MTPEQAEVVALAGTIEMLNAAFPRSAPWNENSYISIDALPELFARRDQQHTAELARRSGKIPATMNEEDLSVLAGTAFITEMDTALLEAAKWAVDELAIAGFTACASNLTSALAPYKKEPGNET